MTARPTRSQRARAWTRWIPAVLWAGVIFAGSSVPGSRIPGGYAVEGHLLEYAILGIAVLFAEWRTPTRRAVVVALVVCALYALSDETHQAFVPLRTPDPLDWLTDMIGAGVAIATTIGIREWAARRRPTDR